MLSEKEYLALRHRYDEYEKARKRICKSLYCVTPEEAKKLPTAIGNDNVSRMEVYEFVHDPPTRYFTYVNLEKRIITTWVGAKLGEILGAGLPFRSNVGDMRVNITVKGINGVVYHGTFYKSSGDYCRLRAERIRSGTA